MSTPFDQALAHIDRCCFAVGGKRHTRSVTKKDLADLVTARFAEGMAFDPGECQWLLAAVGQRAGVKRLAELVRRQTLAFKKAGLL